MKVSIHSLDGKAKNKIDLPSIFEEDIRPDLINRASLAVRSREYQPHGTFPLAGLQTSATYIGRRKAYRSSMNIGRARLPKIKLPKGRHGDVRRVPQAVKGRAAHPPKTEKILVEKINKKERRKAIRSAIAATAHLDLVKKRGHKTGEIKEVPVIVEDGFESLKKTKDIKEILVKLRFGNDLDRASIKKIRAGRGKSRGRKYRRKRSVLLVINEDKGIIKAAKNIPGVDVSLAKNLNADLLAPGGVPGRLAVYTESAIVSLNKLFR